MWLQIVIESYFEESSVYVNVLEQEQAYKEPPQPPFTRHI